MYTTQNFKTKKALKAAGQLIRVYSPGPFPCPTDGKITLKGPHYPAPYKWYAEATLKDGIIVKVS